MPLLDGATSDHNFGHAWLHYIDRIQARILNIFGVVDVYPRRVLQPVKDFVAQDGDNGA
jgi:hypothetical protein